MTYTPHPLRIRRANFRAKLPPGAVSVARPSKYGNPFMIFPNGGGEYSVQTESRVICQGLTYNEAAVSAVALYCSWLQDTEDGRAIAEQARKELKGKELACFCALNKPCHADVLAEAVNREDDQ